jgi:hypothetical protein
MGINPGRAEILLAYVSSQSAFSEDGVFLNNNKKRIIHSYSFFILKKTIQHITLFKFVLSYYIFMILCFEMS